MDAVWEVLRAFGDVSAWAPGIAGSQCLDGRTGGLGVRRRLRHVWGFEFDEVVTAWDEGRGYSFIVLGAPFPLNVVVETWKVVPGPGHAVVETVVTYDTRGGAVGRLIDGVLLWYLIRREMRRGLAGLRSRLAGAPQER